MRTCTHACMHTHACTPVHTRKLTHAHACTHTLASAGREAPGSHPHLLGCRVYGDPAGPGHARTQDGLAMRPGEVTALNARFPEAEGDGEAGPQQQARCGSRPLGYPEDPLPARPRPHATQSSVAQTLLRGFPMTIGRARRCPPPTGPVQCSSAQCSPPQPHICCFRAPPNSPLDA